MKLVDKDGRGFDPDTDAFGYMPDDKNIFLDQVNPGVTKDGEVGLTPRGRLTLEC